MLIQLLVYAYRASMHGSQLPSHPVYRVLLTTHGLKGYIVQSKGILGNVCGNPGPHCASCMTTDNLTIYLKDTFKNGYKFSDFSEKHQKC